MARRSDATERFTDEAEASGLQVEVQRYPDGTRTAADAAAAVQQGQEAPEPGRCDRRRDTGRHGRQHGWIAVVGLA